MWAHSDNNLKLFRDREFRETKNKEATMEF